MSRNTVDRCCGTSLHFKVLLGEGLVVGEVVGSRGWVEGELAQEFAGAGVDDADVEVGNKGEDAFALMFAAEDDVA
jgi:hypothetical protein